MFDLLLPDFISPSNSFPPCSYCSQGDCSGGYDCSDSDTSGQTVMACGTYNAFNDSGWDQICWTCKGSCENATAKSPGK